MEHRRSPDLDKLACVTAPNLTRDQARDRAAILDVSNYQIELDLTDGSGAPGTTTFRSTTTVRFTATEGSETFVDLVAPTLISATLNGVDLDVSGFDESVGIPLPGLAADNTLTVVADCAYSNTGEGLHRFVDQSDNSVYLYSQFETADAKRMFACFDQPDLKATYTVTVTAPADWKVISNAAHAEAPGEPDGSTSAVVHRFRETVPMSTYLVALIAGPYAEWTDVYSDEHGDIPLGIYCRASLAEHMDAERLFTRPNRASASTTRTSGSLTPSANTTSCSSPSSTPARWRTPAP